MPDFQYQDTKAYCAVSGAGETVVMLHAGASSGAQWRKVGGDLEDRYRLLAPDLFGFGKTDPWRGTTELSHDHNAALVHAIVEAEGAGPVHLVGHSYGGATAIRFVLAHPALVRRLVLIEPVATTLLQRDGQGAIFEEYRSMAETFMRHVSVGDEEAAWRFFIDYRNGSGTWDTLPDAARKRFHAGTVNTVTGLVANLSNPTTLRDCRSIAAPTLIICGQETTEPDRRVTEILHREIPNSEYMVIAGADHMSPMSHPAEIAAAIASHLG